MNQEDCYKKMYLCLTNEITDTIERLKVIQQKAEHYYITYNEPTEESDIAKISTLLP